MNKVELISKFAEFNKPFYTFAELQILLGLEKLSANKRIIDLVDQKFLLKLSKNIFVPTYQSIDILQIANTLYQPSYISLEYALYHYQIWRHIPECITIVTLDESQLKEIKTTKVVFSKIKHELFFGFIKIGDLIFAKPEKALADIIYMSSFGKFKLDKLDIDFSKINISEFDRIIENFPLQTQKIAKELL